MGVQRASATRYARRAGEPAVAVVAGVPRREGGIGVSELQRARMLNSAVQVVMQDGYGQMSVARVTGGAGVSRRTFYELFEDREACFLAAFDQAVSEMSVLAASAWQRERLWPEQVRAALGALLVFLDEQPGVASLVLVEALGAGPRMLAHRARLLTRLARLVDKGRAQMVKGRQRGAQQPPPPLTAEGVVGAVLSVIHARLVDKPGAPLARLLNPLMVMILTPYLGRGPAALELQRPVPRGAPRKPQPAEGDPLEGLNMRVTTRTLRVLTAITERPAASNRQVADAAGVSDQGQISKLLARLEGLGLIENTAPPQPTGEPNAWQLTARGRRVQQSTQIQEGFLPSATEERTR